MTSLWTSSASQQWASGVDRDTNRIFAAGLLTGRENARTEAAMAAATKAYEGLTKVKPFWR